MTDENRNPNLPGPLDENRIANAGNDADLQLVVDYLRGQLDADRVALVSRRLDEDVEFRAFAAPLLLTWNVPPRWKRHPRPAGELEKHWDEFTRRAGFVHQRRKTLKRRWIMFVVGVLLVASAGLAFQAPLREAYRERRDWLVLEEGDTVMTLRNGVRVRLEKGARLRYERQRDDTLSETVRLEGSAHFAVDGKWKDGQPVPLGIAVITPHARVFSTSASFAVTIRGDTTEIEVDDRQWDAGKALGLGIPMIVPEMVLMTTIEERIDAQLIVRSGEKGGMYGGQLRHVRQLPTPLPAFLRRGPDAGSTP